MIRTACVMAGIVLVVMLAGCSSPEKCPAEESIAAETVPKTVETEKAAEKVPSDEDLIQQTLDQWALGLTERDMDKFLATISESFSAGPADSKESLANFIRQGIDAGYLDGAEVSREDAQYTMEEALCKVYPVDLMSNAGAVSVEVVLKKENGKWLVSGLEVDGM